MFEAKALIIGQKNRKWGLYEIASFVDYDHRTGSFMEVLCDGDLEDYESAALFDPAQPTFWDHMPQREADREDMAARWSGQWVIDCDDVVAFVYPDQIEWVTEQIASAYADYTECGSTDRAWDTFQVKVRLLL